MCVSYTVIDSVIFEKQVLETMEGISRIIDIDRHG